MDVLSNHQIFVFVQSVRAVQLNCVKVNVQCIVSV